MRQSNLLSGPEVSTLVRAGLWLAVLGGAIWFLTQIQVTLTIFCLAWLIAYLTRPLVFLFEGKRLGPIRRCPRSVAVGAIYFCLCAALFAGGSLAIPAVSGQFNGLLHLQDTLYHPEQLAATIEQHGERLVNLVPQKYRATLTERLQASLGSLTTMLGQAITNGLGYLATFFKQLAAGTAIFLTSLLISIYLLFSWESMYESVIRACPLRYRPNIIELLATFNKIFGGYLRATIVTSALNALGVMVGLTLFSVISGRDCPYAYLISLIAGLTYPIPLFGILSAVVTAGLLAFLPTGDATTGLLVAGVVLSISTTIDRTLQPKLMGDAIGVSPMFVIFAAAAGGEFLGGVWGMLLGIPLAAIIKALFTWFHDLFLVDPSAHDLEPLAPDALNGADSRAQQESALPHVSSRPWEDPSGSNPLS